MLPELFRLHLSHGSVKPSLFLEREFLNFLPHGVVPHRNSYVQVDPCVLLLWLRRGSGSER